MSRRWRHLALEIGVTALLVALLWRFTQTNDDLSVATFSEIWDQFHKMFLFDRFWSDIIPTLRRIALGFSMSVIAGLLIGLALGYSLLLRALAGPVIAFIRATPAVALIPPMIILIGIQDNMKLTVVLIVAIWPIALNTAEGVLEVDQTLKDTTVTFRLTRWQRLRYATMPSVAPRLFSGMQLSLTAVIILVVATEYLAGTDGLGYIINQAQTSYLIAQMWAGVVFLGLLGYLLNFAFNALRARVLYWLPATSGAAGGGEL